MRSLVGLLLCFDGRVVAIGPLLIEWLGYVYVLMAIPSIRGINDG